MLRNNPDSKHTLLLGHLASPHHKLTRSSLATGVGFLWSKFPASLGDHGIAAGHLSACGSNIWNGRESPGIILGPRETQTKNC